MHPAYVGLALLAVLLAGCRGTKDDPPGKGGQKTSSVIKGRFTGLKEPVYELAGERFRVQVVASNLEIPWSMAWLASGDMLLTERGGRLDLVDTFGRVRVLQTVPEVDSRGEHGLMGMALSPDFARDRWIYLSYTSRDARGHLQNMIVRYSFDGQRLTERKVLVDSLPAFDFHDGLPLRFGPDGKLYASTGDAGKGQLAQRPDSLAGKFLRMNTDGSIPPDNPLPDSLIWSLGHRNCQGFDWHPVSGLLYATEHGPSIGVDSLIGGGDELNLVTKGGNYGWPMYHHEKNAPGYVAPLVTWTPAIAPSGACFYGGDRFPAWRNKFFFCALRGQALFCATFSAVSPSLVQDVASSLHNDFGRLRAVASGPDGYLYVTTSNRDNRGPQIANSDFLLRLVPAE